jgi:hypothetical protein
MTSTVAKGIALVAMLCGAVLGASARAAPPPPATDRLTFMGGGVDWDGAEDGGGGSLGWLHNFSSSTILGAAGEYQRLGDTKWAFGTLSFALGLGPTRYRSNLYAEVRRGGGDDPTHSFTYSTYILGLVQNVTPRLALQFEDKQLDINQTHGNLPKLGVQYLWGTRFLTQVAYAQSTSPHSLGTKLWTGRADYYGKWANLIVGGATGQATPVVLNFQTGLPIAGTGLNTIEAYVGVTKPFSRVDVTLMADWLQLGDLKRKQLTLNGSVYLNGSAVR